MSLPLSTYDILTQKPLAPAGEKPAASVDEARDQQRVRLNSAVGATPELPTTRTRAPDQGVLAGLAPSGRGPVLPSTIAEPRPAAETARGPNTPEVAALLAAYGKSAPKQVGRPFERVLKWTAKIHDMCTAESGLNKVVDHLMDKDVRRQVFLLEGALKLYRKRYGKAAEKTFNAVKLFEDSLGAYSYARSMHAGAKERGCPPAVVDYLSRQENQARTGLKKLVKAEWMADEKGRVPALKDMIKKLGKKDWDDYGTDRSFLQGEIVRRLDKLSAANLDMDELEDGIHEFRRQLRWIPVYAEATDGLVVLDDKIDAVPEYASENFSELASSKYVRLPPPDRESDPIVFSKSLYVANMRLVLDIGAEKDKGELFERLVNVYTETGTASSPQDAHHQVEQLLGYNMADVKRAAKAKFAQTQKVGHVAALRAQFTQD